MAQQIYKNGTLVVNGVDLSSKLTSLDFDEGSEMQDDTAMGDTARSNASGLIDWSLSATFIQDYAAGSVDATIHPLVGAAAHTVAIKPDSGAIATANPEYSGTAVIEKYKPISGKVGDLLVTTVSWKPASALTRDITP